MQWTLQILRNYTLTCILTLLTALLWSLLILSSSLVHLFVHPFSPKPPNPLFCSLYLVFFTHCFSLISFKSLKTPLLCCVPSSYCTWKKKSSKKKEGESSMENTKTICMQLSPLCSSLYDFFLLAASLQSCTPSLSNLFVQIIFFQCATCFQRKRLIDPHRSLKQEELVLSRPHVCSLPHFH